MADLNEIYQEFYEIDAEDSLKIIKLYEQNQLLLDNKSVFRDKDDFDDYLLLSGQYVRSLENAGKYSKALKYADKFIALVDLKKDIFGIKLNEFAAYWSITAAKGRSLYYLKQYSSSISIFKKLVEWDPDNDNFKEWLDACKTIRRNSVNKLLYPLAAILIVISVILNDEPDNMGIKKLSQGLGFTLFLIAVINEYLVGRFFKFFRRS